MTQHPVLMAFTQERSARLLVNYLQSQHIGAQYVSQVGDH
ncbi:MAG: hypothetical protein ACI81A_002707, partial [Paraglaciecola sp.]